MTTNLDQKLEEVLSNKIDAIYLQENAKQEVKEEKKDETESDEPEATVDDSEDKEEDGESPEKIEDNGEGGEEREDEKEITSNKDENELERKLSGFTKEFKELVKAEKDPVKRELVFQAAKAARAREDRISLELGNTKKEIANFKEFGDLLRTDPKLAIKNLAKRLNLDINSLTDKAVQESDNEYDYRSPEEISRDKKLEDIQQELSQLKNQRQQEVSLTLEQEIDSFENDKDEKGSLKHPHFEKVYESVVDLLAIENQKLGFPKTSLERNQRLERAYKRAVMLDDDLVALKEAEALKRAELKRKREIEEARKNKKFGGRSTNIDVAISDPRARLEKALEHLF